MKATFKELTAERIKLIRNLGALEMPKGGEISEILKAQTEKRALSDKIKENGNKIYGMIEASYGDRIDAARIKLQQACEEVKDQLQPELDALTTEICKHFDDDAIKLGINIDTSFYQAYDYEIYDLAQNFERENSDFFDGGEVISEKGLETLKKRAIECSDQEVAVNPGERLFYFPDASAIVVSPDNKCAHVKNANELTHE